MIRNDAVIGGSVAKNIQCVARGNVNLGKANADFNVLAPLDGNITETTNVQGKLNFKDYFVAGSVTLNKIVRF